MKVLAIFAAILAVAVARPTAGSMWTVSMLDEVLTNPHVNPEVVPILSDALNEIMSAIYTGVGNPFYVDVELPQGVPVILEPVAPAPVVPAPVLPTPVFPTPVETPAVASPLVQITINIDGKPYVAEIPLPVGPVIDRPVPVINRPVPEAVTAAPAVPRPEPEAVIEPEGDSVDSIITEPIIIDEFNPIDVIAVNPVVPGVQPY